MGLILLVEDEPGAAALLHRCIENGTSGHQLAVFPKAAEALSYAAKNKVDLFILDIQLLDYRGTELARQLRSSWLGKSWLPTGKSNATIFW